MGSSQRRLRRASGQTSDLSGHLLARYGCRCAISIAAAPAVMINSMPIHELQVKMSCHNAMLMKLVKITCE